MVTRAPMCISFFFFNDTATTEIYTLSLHDALPISEKLVAFPHPQVPADRPVEQQSLARRRVAHRKSERERCTHAAAEDVRLFRTGQIEQRLGFVNVQVPVERLDAPARQAALAAVVGDAGEIERKRRQAIHLPERLLAAGRGPARDHRAPAAGREHQQMGALALDEVVDPDALDRCEWHGVSCPLSRTTTAAARGRTPSSGEAAKIIA